MTELAWRFVCPLGRAGRFSMTPGQARLYRVIVDHADHHGGRVPMMREAASLTGAGLQSIHERFRALAERGWLTAETVKRRTSYRLSQPVMRFPRVPERLTSDA